MTPLAAPTDAGPIMLNADEVNVIFKLSDSLCAEIMCTALEGGIGYWCMADKIEWTATDGNENYVAFDAYHDSEGEARKRGAKPIMRVTYDTIRAGIALILSKRIINSTDTAAVLLNVLDRDTPMDADAADCVVQAGLFGKLVYG